MNDFPSIFKLVRDEDLTGISGTGLIAWGVEFPDGKVVMRWTGEIAQTSIWENIDELEAIHGHEGKTRVVWLD